MFWGALLRENCSFAQAAGKGSRIPPWLSELGWHVHLILTAAWRKLPEQQPGEATRRWGKARGQGVTSPLPWVGQR